MIDQITTICVETRPEKHQSSINTLLHCNNLFPVKESLLFSSSPVALDKACLNARIKNINNLRQFTDKKDYDYFVLTHLCDYVKTPHLLIVQTDGYILNPDSFESAWLQYHYIGAPWALHPLHAWPPHPNVTEDNRVGNGGFSLRSTELMRATRSMFCELSRHGSFTPDHWYPEDCFIARGIEEWLKKQGFKFAPYEIAKKFSIENRKIEPDEKPFGFHGPQTMAINSIAYL